MAENILDYGGVEGDDSQSAVNDNVAAIGEASKADGDSTVYIPEGTFYVGPPDGSNRWLQPGSGKGLGDAGLSFTGEGPTKSYLVLSENAVSSSDNTFINYASTDHGTVRWEEITFDGNFQNILSRDSSGRIFGINLNGNMEEVYFENFRMRNFHSYGIRGPDEGYSMYIDRCTFEDIAWGRAVQTGGDSISHLFPGQRIVSGEEWVMTNTLVRNIGGNVVNQDTREDSGTERIENCWIEGVGDTLCKESGISKFVIDSLHYRGGTREFESKLSSAVIDNDFNGRGLIKQTSGETAPTWVLNDIDARNFSARAVQLRASSSAGLNIDENWTITGGDRPVRLENINRHDRDSGALVERAASGRGFTFDDFGTLSVHNVENGEIWDASDSDGTIETFHWDDAAGGFGDDGDISYGTESEGDDPFEPDVPSEDEVGINSDGSSDEAAMPEAPLFEDWSTEWASDPDDWAVESGSEYTGGHALTFEHDGDDRARYALSCDAAGEPADVEVLDKFRVPEFTEGDLGFHARVHLRGYGRNGWENGYWIEIEDRADAYRLAKYTNGDLTELDRFGTPAEDTFFYRRFRAEGSEIKAKIWPADESEPDDWDVEVTDDDHADGWVGLGSFDTGVVETDIFGVASGGESVPLPETTESAGIQWESPADGDTVSGTTTLQIAADVEDADDVTVDYRIGDSSWNEAAYNAETGYFEDELDTTQLQNDEYTLEAEATDAQGNTATDEIQVVVENEESGDDSKPTIDRFEITDRSGDVWNRFDVDWAVSHDESELDTVVTKLRSNGKTVSAESTSLCGCSESANFSHTVQVRGAVDELRLSVNDTKNQVMTETKEI